MKRSFLGGQAVLDGVFLLFGHRYALAVGTSQGIVLRSGSSRILQSSLVSVPFVRGILILFALLHLGLKSTFIASKLADDEVELPSWLFLGTVFFSLVGAILLFFLLPLYVAHSFVSVDHVVLFNVVDGLVRIILLVCYVLLISFIPEMYRLFMLHGAEHKVINAFERTGTLSLAAARSQSMFHPRCGTSFIVLVLLVAIAVYSVTPLDLPFWLLLLTRIAYLIPIASLTYELILFASAHPKYFSWLLKPGFLIQRLTVRPPKDAQLRIALAAARALLR